MIISATEDWNTGDDGSSTVGADPYIIVAGGATDHTSGAAYGLTSWGFVGQFIDFNGVTVAGAKKIVPNGGKTTPALSLPP